MKKKEYIKPELELLDVESEELTINSGFSRKCSCGCKDRHHSWFWGPCKCQIDPYFPCHDKHKFEPILNDSIWE